MRLVLLIAIIILGAGLVVRLVGRTGNEIRRSRAFILEQQRSDLLLPDLKIAPPKVLYIVNSPGIHEIRFDTTFFNIGKGPLELVGESDETSGTTIATQIINKIDTTKEARRVGEFIYHTGHSHWHLEKYSQFQLWRYNAKGQPVELVATTDKMSFCIWDEHPYDLENENAPKVRQYPRCLNDTQGNSVGWGDTYPAALEGQELNILSVPDGNYLIRSTVNVDKKILERDYENNTANLYVELSGNTIRKLDNF